MPQLKSKLDPLSPAFTANAAHMRTLVDELNNRTSKEAHFVGQVAEGYLTTLSSDRQ
jgi:hypothetical protein